MVGTDLEGLLPPHQEPELSSRGILQEFGLAQSSFLPLLGIVGEPEELGSLFENNFLILFSADDLDNLWERDDWDKVCVWLVSLWRIIFTKKTKKACKCYTCQLLSRSHFFGSSKTREHLAPGT